MGKITDDHNQTISIVHILNFEMQLKQEMCYIKIKTLKIKSYRSAKVLIESEYASFI